jgi:deoxyhypusine monooxygenase
LWVTSSHDSLGSPPPPRACAQSGEALGAIADPAALPVLEAHARDAAPEVAETCQIAAARLRWAMEKGSEAGADGHLGDNPFHSVDPAPATKKPTREEVAAVKATLLDRSLPLFERYRAMFSLRNNRGKTAVLVRRSVCVCVGGGGGSVRPPRLAARACVQALCEGLKDPSPLFRHEIAYVLGQLAHPASAPALQAAVADAAEHEMVRHEAAEALGAIGTEEACEFLRAYEGDSTVMLRESCVVALDIADYWGSDAAEGVEGSAAK